MQHKWQSISVASGLWLCSQVIFVVSGQYTIDISVVATLICATFGYLFNISIKQQKILDGFDAIIKRLDRIEAKVFKN